MSSKPSTSRRGRPRSDTNRTNSADYGPMGHRIKRTIIKRLRIYSAKSDRPAAEIVEEAVDQYLKRRKA